MSSNWVLAGAVASILTTGNAMGKESASTSGVEEIVVTATRREESLREVPLAVTAVTAENLVARGVNGLSDLKPGAIPGFVVSQFAGTPSVLALSVRGVGLSDPTQGTTEMTVPLYVDGVFLGRAQGLGLELIEPERIEVLRGPQGQLFGRNAEGGVVQFVSRKPTGELGIKGSASFGNYDDQRYRLSVDLPAVGGLSSQFSGVVAKHDAYTKNVQQGTYAEQSDYGYLDSYGGRGALRWQNDSGFTADYSYDYSKTKDSQPYLTWMDVDAVRTAFSPELPSTDYPSKTIGPVYNRPFDTRASGHALTLTYQMDNGITLKSISAYRKASRHGGSNLGYPLPAGGSSTGLVFPLAQEDLDQDQTSQELQFIGSWSQFDLTAGAMYYTEDVTDRRRSIISGAGLTPPALGISPPGLAFCVNNDPCLTGDSIQSANSDSYGVYAQGTYRPAAAPKLELTAGLRYTDDKKDAERTRNFFPLPVPQQAKFDATRVDPAATIKYSWTNNFSTYLRYATGYRAGGANVRSSTFTSFDEEENNAWELGMKSLLADNRLALNVALFYNTIKGEQLNIQEAPTTNPSLTNTVNSDRDKKVKGAEVEVSWRALEDLTLGLNFAYMDAKKTRELDNPFTVATDITRFWTVQVPETSGSVTLDYAYRALPVGYLALHADYSYADDYWTTPGAVLTSSLLPTYERPTADVSQLAARLSWRDISMGDTKMEVALWGKNLTDDSSIIYGFDGCASGGGFCAYRTQPRTYGVEVRMSYR